MLTKGKLTGGSLFGDHFGNIIHQTNSIFKLGREFDESKAYIMKFIRNKVINDSQEDGQANINFYDYRAPPAGLIFGRFYSRYSVIFPMPKSIFFSQFSEEISQFQVLKNFENKTSICLVKVGLKMCVCSMCIQGSNSRKLAWCEPDVYIFLPTVVIGRV